MDRERASFADNTVKYEATLRFINGHVRTMLDAMKVYARHNQASVVSPFILSGAMSPVTVAGTCSRCSWRTLSTVAAAARIRIVVVVPRAWLDHVAGFYQVFGVSVWAERVAIALGHGVHSCLGAALARMESRIAIEEMAARWPRYEVDDAGLHIRVGATDDSPGEARVLMAVDNLKSRPAPSGHAELVSAPFSKYLQIFSKVFQFRIAFHYQINFPLTMPTFQLLFSVNCILKTYNTFVIHQIKKIIL